MLDFRAHRSAPPTEAHASAAPPSRLRGQRQFGYFAIGPLLILNLMASSAGPVPGASTNGTHFSSHVLPLATNPTGNLSISATLPSVGISAGSLLEAGYLFHIVSFPSKQPAIKFYVPGIQFTFPNASGGGKILLWDMPRNFSITGTTWVGSNVTKSFGSSGTSFSKGSLATMSSELLAVMNTVRWGTVQIDIQWSWYILSKNGSRATGISPLHTVAPQEYLRVASAGPATDKPGQNYTVCVSGSYIGARTLSLHMEVPAPYQAIAWSNTKVPSNSTHWCWSVQVPKSFHAVPSPLIVHIWSYATQPGILYVLHLQAV